MGWSVLLRRMSTKPRMAASGLPISWATPAASWPTEASFSVRMSCSRWAASEAVIWLKAEARAETSREPGPAGHHLAPVGGQEGDLGALALAAELAAHGLEAVAVGAVGDGPLAVEERGRAGRRRRHQRHRRRFALDAQAGPPRPQRQV